jgi:hypothetical protein
VRPIQAHLRQRDGDNPHREANVVALRCVLVAPAQAASGSLTGSHLGERAGLDPDSGGPDCGQTERRTGSVRVAPRKVRARMRCCVESRGSGAR